MVQKTIYDISRMSHQPNLDDMERVESSMRQTNPFLPDTPPPIPPKPKKFSRNSLIFNPASISTRPPMASPPNASTSTDHMPQQGHKRKLTVNIPGISSSSSTNFTPTDLSEASICKSPKVDTPGQRRIWSPAICTICMDDLFSYEEIKSRFNLENNPSSATTAKDCSQNNPQPETLRPTVSTRCGHLFHTECINKWFMENKEKEIKECPFCKREMMANDTTRIFPIFEDP